MATAREFFELLRDDLLAIEDRFSQDAVSTVASITDIGNYLREGGGKRIRPSLLLLAAKSHALLQGRLNVSCDDVRSYVLPVLRHRVLCNFAAASEGVDSDEIVRRLVEAVPEPDYARGD